MRDNLRASGEQKIHVTMKINFISAADSDDSQSMHSKSDSIEVIIGNNTDKIINELFSSLLARYQMGLETSLKLQMSYNKSKS